MKIYYYNRRINGQYDSLRTASRRIVHNLTRLAITTGIFTAVFFAGAMLYSTSTVDAQMIHTTTVLTPEYPVLDRIADCESGNGTKGSATQFRNGQTIMRANTNGTVDVGMYQINTIWFKKATSLGYDLTTAEGNRSMSEWLYLNKGTAPWASSAKCWNI